jgi:polyisoprenoid-binding protein YceI
MIRTALLLAALAVTGQAAAATYTFDQNHTVVRFQWNHKGFSNPSAGFTQFQGEVELDAENLANSRVNVTLPVAGIESNVPDFNDHLKSADFFDMAKFANATFKSTQVEEAGTGKLKVTGDLTIHGVTRPVTLDVTINQVTNERAGFDASTTINRSDFGLGKYVPNVSDEVRIAITTELEAKK